MQLQERIATKITAHLLQELGKHEQVRAYESRIDDLTTWQLVHRGHWHMARRTSTGVARAKKLYERALERDEYQSEALVALAWWHFWKAWSEHGIKQTDHDLEESTRLCRKALLMDRSDGRVHAYLGAIAIMRNQAASAVSFFDEAIRLNPSLSFAYSSRGSANLYLGKPELAPSDIRNALGLNPADYYRFHSLAELAAAYYFSSELDKSIEAAESSSFLAPRYW
jgi:tetratricopeptide (TPR) repeat protein